MKTLNDLANKIKKMADEAEKKATTSQIETAQVIWGDVVDIAPFKTGEYVSSIQVYPTENKNGKITTFIGSDLMVGPAKSTGKSYNLGYLLEHGTLHHAIPNAFDWGRIYGYNSQQYFRTCQSDWHPGSVAIPHYQIALEKNKKLYKDKIKLTWR